MARVLRITAATPQSSQMSAVPFPLFYVTGNLSLSFLVDPIILLKIEFPSLYLNPTT